MPRTTIWQTRPIWVAKYTLGVVDGIHDADPHMIA